MWCIVSRDGLRGLPHNHRGKISGAYYIACGDSDGDSDSSKNPNHNQQVNENIVPNGAIQFYPRLGQILWPSEHYWENDIAQFHDGIATVKPQAGLLLLFPSHLVHSVYQYQGSRERIVVSFNLD
jgi:hypothetical protein